MSTISTVKKKQVAKRMSTRKRTAADEPDDVPSSSKTLCRPKNLCTICGGPAVKIEKDTNYNTMVQLFLCTLGVDVKPEACNKTDLCRKCFDKLLSYYETNDIIVYFENFFKSLRSTLLKKTLKGIDTWEEVHNQPLNNIQEQIKRKYGSFAEYQDPNITETKQAKKTLEGYVVDCYEILDDDSESSRKGIKISKNSLTISPDNCAKRAKISLKNANGTLNDENDDDESNENSSEESANTDEEIE